MLASVLLQPVAFAADVPAQTPPSGIHQTEEAVRLALANSRQLRSLETQVSIQEHSVQAAGSLDNPELRLRNLSSRSGGERFGEMEIGLRWRPPQPGERAEARQQGQVRLWEEKTETLRARHWLASRVRRACADIRLYRALVGLATLRVANEARRIEQIQGMVDLGRRSIVYYTKAKLEVTQAKNERNRYLRALHDEERRLQRLTGAGAPVEIAAETEPPAIDLERETLLEIAYAHRPEIALARRRQELAGASYKRQGRRLPTLSFIEISHHREQGDNDWQELTLGLELPVFGATGSRKTAAALSVDRTENEMLVARERVADEVDDAFAAYSEARLAWKLARDDGQLLIEEATRVIGQAQTHGSVRADEILELERTVGDAREIIARRRREAAHAVYFLWYALGIERPEQAAPAGE